MKNLTENQQEIIDLITNEFVLINEKKATETDDIFAYIDSEVDQFQEEVNKRKLYIETIKKRNDIYEEIIVEKMDSILERVNKIVSKYCGYCKMGREWKDGGGLICSRVIEVYFMGYKNESVYYFSLKLETNRQMEEDYLYLYSDTDVEITLDQDGKCYALVIEESELDKKVAELVIENLKYMIKSTLK